MPETPPSVLDRFLGSDVTMYTGPGEIPQAYANKMLLAALQEAQSVVRSYDTKAQIVGVGYILALNLILHFGDLLPACAARPAVLRSSLGCCDPSDRAVWPRALPEPGARREGASHEDLG